MSNSQATLTLSVDSLTKEANELEQDKYSTAKGIFQKPYTKSSAKALSRELLSGLTVALAQIPEAVAFSIIAGVDPLIGLHAAWIVGLITALAGGAPGMISGATGALAVVLPDFIEEFGVGYMFIAVFFMGIIQIVLGFMGVAKLIKLIGEPVMLGFVNGLAIVIFQAQFPTFENEEVSSTLWQLFLAAITMLVVWLLPKLTKIVPSSLCGILLACGFEYALIRPLGFETKTVGKFSSGFPIPIWFDDRYSDNIPSLFELKTYEACLPLAFTLAIIGLVESLMTLQLVEEITAKKCSGKRESIAQGAANFIAGIFGTMGGCAMIGQSMINVKSGGVTRISSTFAALFLLFILLVANPLIQYIPLASLAGVMFMVVIHTFEWNTLLLLASFLPQKYREHEKIKQYRKVKRTDVAIIILVSLIATLLHNLAIAVGAGIAFSSVLFAWDQSFNLKVNIVDTDLEENSENSKKASSSFSTISSTSEIEKKKKNRKKNKKNKKLEKEKDIENQNNNNSQNTNDLETPGSNENIKIYSISGPLFFASTDEFLKMFDYQNDPEIIEIQLENAQICDYSSLVVLNRVAQKYFELGKILRLRKITKDSFKRIQKAHYIMYTYDKKKTLEENQEELLAMEYLPTFQQIETKQ